LAKISASIESFHNYRKLPLVLRFRRDRGSTGAEL